MVVSFTDNSRFSTEKIISITISHLIHYSAYGSTCQEDGQCLLGSGNGWAVPKPDSIARGYGVRWVPPILIRNAEIEGAQRSVLINDAFVITTTRVGHCRYYPAVPMLYQSCENRASSNDRGVSSCHRKRHPVSR